MAADVVDRGAIKRSGNVEWPDLYRLGALAASGGLSLASGATRLATDLLGLPGSIVPVALAFVGLLWAWHLVTSKGRRDRVPGLVESPLVYAFHQPIRQFAKLAAILLIVLLVRQTHILADDLTSLPTTIYGYLVDARNGGPAEGALVRIVDRSGVDVTLKQLPSDSVGFYVVHTSRNVRRNATGQVMFAPCSAPSALPLYRIFETGVDAYGAPVPESLSPVFRHTLVCR